MAMALMRGGIESMETRTRDLSWSGIWGEDIVCGRVLIACLATYCVICFGIFVIFPEHVLDILFYFTYMTLACTVLPFPTHSMVILYGMRYGAVPMAILGGIGTSLSALIDYILLMLLFRHVKQLKIEKVRSTRIYQRFERWFYRSSFATILTISFIPIPLELAKVLGCVTRYNMMKFLLAIFLGRGVRYYILGEFIIVKPIYLYISIPAMVAIEMLRRLVKKGLCARKMNGQSKEENDAVL
jgi:membrane protein YqaA with SNARE-associated domain